MTNRYALLGFVPLLLLAFWLGARQLDSDAIWLDEYFSIYDAGGGAYGPLNPADIWQRVATRNPWHAPGFFILLSGWGAVAGWEPAALRAFSLLLGVLAVALTYRLGRDLVSPRVGLYAAVILGTSAFFVYYTHEIRMYTLIALLAEAAVWLYIRLIRARREPGLGAWLAFLAVLVAVLYTHYLAAFPLVGIAAYHLLFAPKNRRWWKVVGIAALAGVLYLPWANNLFAGVGLAAEAEELHNRALSTRRVLEMVAYLFGNGFIALPALFGLLALPSLRGQRARALWVIALVTLAAILLANQLLQIIPITRLRYLLSLWPLFALLVALAVDQLRRWHPLLALAALALWAGAGIYSAGNPEFVSHLASAEYTFPLHRIDDVMREQGRAGDFAVNYLSPGMAAVTYDRTADFYFGRRGIAFDNIEPKANAEQQAAEHAAALDALRGYDRVWLAYEAAETPELAEFRAALEADYTQCAVALNDTMHLILYARGECV